MWDDQVAACATATVVIRYDTRGFGDGDRRGDRSPTGPTSPPRPRPRRRASAHVVGLSRGAMIALDFALAELPGHRVRSLLTGGRRDRRLQVAGGAPGIDAGRSRSVYIERRTGAAIAEWETAYWVDGPGQSPDRGAATSAADVARLDPAELPGREGRGRSRSRSSRRPSSGSSDLRAPCWSSRGTLDDRHATIDAPPRPVVPGARLESSRPRTWSTSSTPERFDRLLPVSTSQARLGLAGPTQ